MTEIKEKDLQNLEKKYSQNDKARVVRNALTSNDISTISNVLEAQEANPRYFSIDLAKLPVTNQMQSGRCWIFSSMNVLREMIAKKYKIDGQFELSQNFIAFYDKLEKANWFMECVTKELDNPLDERTMQWLLDTGVGDGGQWNMVVSIIKKYGLCPKSAMPETYQSSHTHSMNGILNKRLRRFAIDAKKAHDAGDDKAIASLRKDALQEVYGLLCDCFGVPPKSFTFEYYDNKKEYHGHRNVTPLEFYEKYLGGQPNSEKAHHLLHTTYENLNGVFDAVEVVESGKAEKKFAVSVCVTPGTDEDVSAKALADVLEYAAAKGLSDKLVIETAFAPSCTKRKAGEVIVGGRFFSAGELDAAKQEMEKAAAL